MAGVAAPPAVAPSPSATPTLASAPEDANQKTDAGAKAFAEYYFETVLNEAYSLGKLDKLVEVSDPDCAICRATVGDIAFFTIDRQRAEGGKVSVSGIKVANTSEELTTIELTYAAEKLTYKNLGGETSYTVPARSGLGFFVQLEWVADLNSWRVAQIVDKATIEGKLSPSPSPTA